MDFLKKHADTVAIIGGILTSVLWMNGKFNDVDKKFNEMDKKFSTIEKDMAVIKTVLIMKEIMPDKLAKHEEGK
jgi:hypothetical protein